jgi:transporter family protein
MWIFWALVSALTAATRRTQEKKLANELHHTTISLMVQILSLPVIAAFTVIDHAWLPLGQLSKAFWLPLIATSIGFYPLNAFLYWQAMKKGELSRVLPLQSLWPVLSLLPAWLFLRETPSLIACAGIASTVLGVYALGLKGRSLHHPLQPFREDRASLYMLLSVILVTAAGVLDNIAIRASNAAFYSLTSTVGAIIALSINRRMRGIQDIIKVRHMLQNLIVTGTLQGTSYTTYLLAMAAGPVAYVTTIRSSNILIGTALGIVLLRERLTKPKLLSLVLILVGGIVLAVGS